MPNELTDLELDEVSLVGKAANGKRFLIFKSEGVQMTNKEPAGATGAGEALVSKADILGIVQKAIEPLKEENARLKKSLETQAETLRTKDYVEIAKSEFSELGKPDEVAKNLQALEKLDGESRKSILKIWKQTNAMKKEAGSMLYKTVGSSRPAPGSHRAEFSELLEKKLAEVRKSGKGSSDPIIQKSLAMDELSKEFPELAQQVIAEQRAENVKRQMGVA